MRCDGVLLSLVRQSYPQLRGSLAKAVRASLVRFVWVIARSRVTELWTRRCWCRTRLHCSADACRVAGELTRSQRQL